MAYKKLKYWFDEELAGLLADKLLEVVPDFRKSSFVKNIRDKVDPLELKDRVEIIADELFIHLGSDYRAGLKVLMQILGPENEEETGMFTNFYWLMPVAKFVEKYGQDDFELSMNAIREITKRNTGEYTIRPFLEYQTAPALKVMQAWSKDPNRHVRRLSCEGLRPRLPWAGKLDIFIENPAPIIPVLENLKDDPSRYVQKSVANCLNDILKDNPETGKEIIERWNTGNIGNERKWIIRHALRNRIKARDSWALTMVENHKQD